MALPITTSQVLAATYEPALFQVEFDAGLYVITYWDASLGTQPTEQQITDWSTDAVALPSSQLFSAWQAEHGGDPVLTKRRTGKAVIGLDDGLGVAQRAELDQRNKRDNYLATRLLELQARVQAMCDSTGAVANMRTDGLAVSISATQTRPNSTAVQDLLDAIDAGDAD